MSLSPSLPVTRFAKISRSFVLCHGNAARGGHAHYDTISEAPP
ncbi:hypothetical protein HMPREF9946_03617 [Acetobacteraceae bacterium AT-5844]|nr:hypothetical protein HMPREF9946_03617 [Acetobacteraceae bacterium AT-5844]